MKGGPPPGENGRRPRPAGPSSNRAEQSFPSPSRHAYGVSSGEAPVWVRVAVARRGNPPFGPPAGGGIRRAGRVRRPGPRRWGGLRPEGSGGAAAPGGRCSSLHAAPPPSCEERPTGRRKDSRGALSGAPRRLAVAVGFEPTEAFTSHAFEACSFGRSDTPPPRRVQGPGGLPEIGRSRRTRGG